MECALNTKIECERSSTIGGNRGVVDWLGGRGHDGVLCQSEREE